MSTSFSVADSGIARMILTFSSNVCSSDNNVLASSLGFLGPDETLVPVFGAALFVVEG